MPFEKHFLFPFSFVQTFTLNKENSKIYDFQIDKILGEVYRYYHQKYFQISIIFFEK